MIRNLLSNSHLNLWHDATQCTTLGAAYRSLHATPVARKAQAGRYKVTRDRSRPLTYEMANQPCMIAHRKSWNSWNTTSLYEGMREPETVVEDIFYTQIHDWDMAQSVCFRGDYQEATQHGQNCRDCSAEDSSPKMYFLTGYCEELLSYWLKCPVKLELQTVADKENVIYKYI